MPGPEPFLQAHAAQMEVRPWSRRLDACCMGAVGRSDMISAVPSYPISLSPHIRVCCRASLSMPTTQVPQHLQKAGTSCARHLRMPLPTQS